MLTIAGGILLAILIVITAPLWIPILFIIAAIAVVSGIVLLIAAAAGG